MLAGMLNGTVAATEELPEGVGFNPSWSPDGQKIVFGRQVDSQPRDIYTLNADGSGLFRVTNTPDIEEFSAEWGTHPLTP